MEKVLKFIASGKDLESLNYKIDSGLAKLN